MFFSLTDSLKDFLKRTRAKASVERYFASETTHGNSEARKWLRNRVTTGKRMTEHKRSDNKTQHHGTYGNWKLNRRE